MAENNERKPVEAEAKIKERIKGDSQKNALDFVAFYGRTIFHLIIMRPRAVTAAGTGLSGGLSETVSAT